MFGMFQRRGQRPQSVEAVHGSAQVSRGDPLLSFVSMNIGDRALSARERQSVARRIEMASPLDNPLSALDANAPLPEMVSMTPAPAFMPPTSATPSTQPSGGQPGASAPLVGGMTW